MMKTSMLEMGKVLIIGGIFMVVIGLAVMGKLGPVGKLPGDILISKENISFYFPITTSILISVVLSIVLWLMNK